MNVTVKRTDTVFTLELNDDEAGFLQGISSMGKEVAEAVYGKDDFLHRLPSRATTFLAQLNKAIIEARHA